MTEMTTADRDKNLRKAYGKATQDLREKHRGDFDALYSKRAKELGVEWTPRKSPEQKAAEEFDTLLEQHPFLRERLANPEPTLSVVEDENGAEEPAEEA